MEGLIAIYAVALLLLETIEITQAPLYLPRRPLNSFCGEALGSIVFPYPTGTVVRPEGAASDTGSDTG